MNNGVQIFVIEGIPDIQPGDKLDQIIGKCLEEGLLEITGRFLLFL